MVRGFESDPKNMPILAHLEELRSVLVHAFLFLLAGVAITWVGSGVVLDWIIERLQLDQVQFLSPMEPFNARFQVALLLGLGVSMPFIAFRVWTFVVPALQIRERRVIVPSAVATGGLFAAGTAFALFFLAPFMLKFLIGFGTEKAIAGIALGPLLNFVFRLSLACALLFQMPLVLALLTLLGVVTPRRLLGWWRHATIVIFVLAAAVTPGDGPSQIALAVPLTVLYFLSVLVSWFVWRATGRSTAGEVEATKSTTPVAPDWDDARARGRVPPNLRAPEEPPAGTRARGSDDPPEDPK